MTDNWFERKKKDHAIWQTLKTAAGLTYYYNRETNETTWDCPPELATDNSLGGEWYWIPNESNLFINARKVGVNAYELESGDKVSVRSNAKIYPLNQSSLERIVEDLVLLDDLHPPLILHNLKERYKREKIYTQIGTILIALNPYKNLPIYGPEIIDDYQSSLRNYEEKNS